MAAADEIKIRIIAKDEASKVIGQTRNELGGLKSAAKLAGVAIAGIATSQAIRSFVDISAKFETMKKSLVTVTGSAGAANQAFALIQKSAQQMPFSVQELTQSFIKMRSLGINPTEETLKSFANTASATGKSFDQFAEAVADAMTGEFERLKEFGIKASQEQDKVSFTFQGTTTTVGKNSQEIIRYLKSIGEVQFAGAAVDQMDTLSGSFSNFGDAIDQVVVSFGNMKGITQIVNSLSDGLREFAKWLRITGDVQNIQSLEEIEEAVSKTKVALTAANKEVEKFAKLTSDDDVEGGGILSAAEAEATRLKNRLDELLAQQAKIKDEMSRPAPTTLTIGGDPAAEAELKKMQENAKALRALGYDNEKTDLRNSYAEQLKIIEEFENSKQKVEFDAARAKQQIMERVHTETMNQFGQGITALGQYNKTAFKISKAFNIGNAIMNTYAGATKALATYPPPFSYIAAAGQVAFGMAQVAQIRSQSFQGKAVGGAVQAGTPYMVGEQGREMFVPSTNGQIVKNSDVERMGSSAGSTNINFTINAIDTRGFSELLNSKRSQIVNMVNQAMNDRGRVGVTA